MRKFDVAASKVSDFTGEFHSLGPAPGFKNYAIVAWPTIWGTFVALGYEFDTLDAAKAYALSIA